MHCLNTYENRKLKLPSLKPIMNNTWMAEKIQVHGYFLTNPKISTTKQINNNKLMHTKVNED